MSKRLLLKDGVSIGIVRFLGAGLAFSLTLVLTRTLGPVGFGTYGLALAVMMILNVGISNGWATLILRRTASAQTEQDWSEAKGLMQHGTLAALVVCAVIFAVGAVAIRFALFGAPALLTYGVLFLLIVVMFFDQLSALRLAALRGLNHPVLGQLPEMVLRPVFVILTIWVIGWWFIGDLSVIHTFWALLVAAAASAAIGAIVLARRIPPALAQAAPQVQPGKWVKAAAFIAANSGLVIINAQLDVLALVALSSLEDVGIYRVAVQVALLGSFVFTALNLLAGQRFAALRSVDDWQGLQTTARFLARLAMIGAMPLLLVFYFAGPDLLRSLFGDAFIAALAPLLILALGHVIAAAFGMAGILLLIAGREREIIGFTVAALIVNLVLCLILIPKLGTSGAAIAMASSRVFWVASVWAYALYREKVDVSVLGFWGSR